MKQGAQQLPEERVFGGVADMLSRKSRVSPFKGEWDFLSRAVWTKDEARGEVRRFPAHLEYIREMIDRRNESPIFAVEKSRRMVVSWTFCALYLYEVLTKKNHAAFIASRKLESSCELVGRLVFMYEHISPDVWADKPGIEIHAGHSGKGYRRIDVPSLGSSVEAVAQGKDQLRQYTASAVFLDEFAFWEKAEESWGALKPTVQGGGRIDMVSTPELGSFMYSLLYEDMAA